MFRSQRVVSRWIELYGVLSLFKIPFGARLRHEPSDSGAEQK